MSDESRSNLAVDAAALSMTELARLDALLAGQERKIAQAFREFVTAIQSTEIAEHIIQLLEARDVEGALQIVDSYVAQMGNVLPKVAHAVGEATAEALSAHLADSTVAIGFDPSLPRAAEIIRANRLEFVQNFTEEQRRATLQALARAYREGSGTAETARAFQGSIGLTAGQEAAVANYRSLLETQNRAALDRQLRDRRYDGVVRRASRSRQPIKPEQVERMVEGYRRRMVAMRSETIARTEGVRATSEASLEAADQMVEQTGIKPAQLTAIWNPTRDGRTRDWHASMAGQKRASNGFFKDGHGNLLRYPGDPAAPAETVINCRCALTFSVSRSA